MKFFYTATLTLLLTAMTTAALAAPFTVTFTADNNVTGFFISENNGSPAAVTGLAGASNIGNWRQATTLDLDLTPGSSYELQWQTDNYGTTSHSNPFAFLAEIAAAGTSSILSSASWEVSTDAVNWTAATEYFPNGHHNSIWWRGNNGRAIAGIAQSAAWIGVGQYPGTTADTMYVRTTFTATPLPAAAWLMGAGLLCMVGLRCFVQKK